ncbi:MAG TPA: hypothetical protein VIJ95_00350 [Hanamia sp.]
MEVHHHPHVDPGSYREKNFKEYFLEFVMIFLALIMGLTDLRKEHEFRKDLITLF